jgi:hypothetical protein
MTGKKWRSILAGMLLLASAVEFGVRGPARLLDGGMGWNDFLSPYIQAKAWVHGSDPYNAKSLIAWWPADVSRPSFVDSEAAAGMLEKKRGMPSPYPLPTLVLVSLFAALPWQVALSLWSTISVAAVIFAVFALLAVCECRLAELRSLLFLAAVLALAPLHTGLATANPAMLAVSLVVGALWASHMRRDRTAGALLALAICLKPTVAGGVLVFYLLRRCWVVVITTCSIVAGIGIVGLCRLAVIGTPWISSYFENSRRMFSTGSVDDFTRTVGLRFNMVNSQVFFGGIFTNQSTVKALSQMLGIVLVACWIWLCCRRRTSTGVLEVSAISIISLIAVYHRFYDAALLIFPLAWSLLVVKRRTILAAALATIAPFFVPGPVLLNNLADTGRIPLIITNSWWWNAIVMPHEAWDLILMAILLLYFLWRQPLESLHESSQVTPGAYNDLHTNIRYARSERKRSDQSLHSARSRFLHRGCNFRDRLPGKFRIHRQ